MQRYPQAGQACERGQQRLSSGSIHTAEAREESGYLPRRKREGPLGKVTFEMKVLFPTIWMHHHPLRLSVQEHPHVGAPGFSITKLTALYLHVFIVFYGFTCSLHIHH